MSFISFEYRPLKDKAGDILDVFFWPTSLMKRPKQWIDPNNKHRSSSQSLIKHIPLRDVLSKNC